MGLAQSKAAARDIFARQAAQQGPQPNSSLRPCTGAKGAGLRAFFIRVLIPFDVSLLIDRFLKSVAHNIRKLTHSVVILGASVPSAAVAGSEFI